MCILRKPFSHGRGLRGQTLDLRFILTCFSQPFNTLSPLLVSYTTLWGYFGVVWCTYWVNPSLLDATQGKFGLMFEDLYLEDNRAHYYRELVVHFMGQPLVVGPSLWILSIRASPFSWSLYSTLVKPLEAMDEYWFGMYTFGAILCIIWWDLGSNP